MKKINMFIISIIMFIMVGTIGCYGPAEVEQFATVEPNETAFLIPLEGATKTNQSEFFSVEYLRENKIATKRFSLPLRKRILGRGWGNFDYIPTMQVIKVSRTPQTREWTSDEKTGTSKSNQSIWVESKDSIGFGVGINATACIEENDAAVFLNKYSGSPLSTIIDKDIRGYINGILAQEFAKYNLEVGRSKKNEIIDIVRSKTIPHFKKYGVTITNIGLSEGMVYEDKEIQQIINDKFVAEMKIQIEDKNNEAQAKINTRNVAIAIAAKDAAVEFQKAKEAQMAMVDLEIRKMEAQAKLMTAEASKTLATGLSGSKLPNILPQGSGLLMGLDGMVK